MVVPPLGNLICDAIVHTLLGFLAVAGLFAAGIVFLLNLG